MATVWLGRWRIAGTNWEGRPWALSEALVQLAREANALWPSSHPADGTVASQPHDAGNSSSDHRPHPYAGAGTVRALDAGETIEGHGELLAEELRRLRDPRTKYVIHESRMFSSYTGPGGEPPWEWRVYRGGDEHLDLVHVSTWPAGDANGAPWGLTLEDDLSKEIVWEALREGRIGSESTDPSILTAIARTYRMMVILYSERLAGVTAAEIADAIAAELPADLAQEVADELHARLAG